MTRFHRCALALVLASLASFVPAQAPPGMPGFNDYTVGGLGSGALSCTLLPLTPGPNTFATSTAPGVSVFLYASILPCAPSSIWACANSQLVLPLPPLSIEIDSGTADAGGDYSVVFWLPPGLTFSTQAVILDPACGTIPILFSQGHDCQT